MFVSLSGEQVLTCSGYDCASHIAISNQNAGWSSKLKDFPAWVELFGEGSFGGVS